MESKNNPFQQFVRCLDGYQNRKNSTILDSIQIFDITQKYYYHNFYHYYEPMDLSANNPYLLWQSQHEFLNFNSLDDLKIEKPAYCFIDVSLNSISDILTMLDSNKYVENTEYNIDLKALERIRPELEQLNKIIGNEQFKKSILRQLLYFIQKFDDSYHDYKHMIITGPPGTGKTEMAKIIGKMYSKLGILKKNIFKKVTRADLVAGYLGQTAIKTKKVIDECIGGVLFFDEAYSLSIDESYSKECVDTLCECLSDNRNNFMMIIAGYENELENSFFKLNSGLKSRFVWRFDIEPYSADELMKIFLKFVKENNWKHTDTINLGWFSNKKEHFLYNGRDMEILFHYVKVHHAHRVYGKDSSLKKLITEEDMDGGFDFFLSNKKFKSQENLFGLYI